MPSKGNNVRDKSFAVRHIRWRAFGKIIVKELRLLYVIVVEDS